MTSDDCRILVQGAVAALSGVRRWFPRQWDRTLCLQKLHAALDGWPDESAELTRLRHEIELLKGKKMPDTPPTPAMPEQTILQTILDLLKQVNNRQIADETVLAADVAELTAEIAALSAQVTALQGMVQWIKNALLGLQVQIQWDATAPQAKPPTNP